MIEDKGFFEKLHKISEEKQTLLCVGLDPHISELTEQTAEAAKTFCKNLID
jgi:orotidine-5'-phosphate decarboxylase